MLSTQPDPERDALLSQATTATVRAIPAAEADPERPVFHFHTPAQWMNDPNAPLFYRGWFHLFYQFNPYGDAWGNMHWGHARSRNLVDWQHLPIALWPSKAKGEAHIFSGSAWRDEKGKPVLFYTSIGSQREPEQWMARAENDDLLTFTKPEANPILTLAVHKSEPPIREWRDPFLFADRGKTFMLVGGGRDGRGVVLLYEAADTSLQAWNYRGVLFEHPDHNLPNVECPNLVRLGNRWVLLTSTHGKVEYFVGTLDTGRGTFTMLTPQSRGIVMDGAYASQIVMDAKNRCIFWAWFQPPHKAGWAGCLTLPSVLSLSDDGTLCCQPLPALDRLRENHTGFKNQPLSGTLDLTDRVTGNTLELRVRLQPGNAASVGVRLCVSPDGARSVEIRYEAETRTLHVSGRASVVLPPSLVESGLDLHVFLDKTVVEVYAAGGAITQTTAAKDDRGIQLFATGGTAAIAALDLYQLKGAQFDRSAFR